MVQLPSRSSQHSRSQSQDLLTTKNRLVSQFYQSKPDNGSFATNTQERISSQSIQDFKSLEYLNKFELKTEEKNHKIVKEINSINSFLKNDVKNFISLNDDELKSVQDKFLSVSQEINQLRTTVNLYLGTLSQNSKDIQNLKKFNKESEEHQKLIKILEKLNHYEEVLGDSTTNLKLIKQKLRKMDQNITYLENQQLLSVENTLFIRKIALLSIIVFFISYIFYTFS
ncbi:hypothetical protein WICMUC_005663 [Wickerhamomyces mucosus]|uniref:Uncharacterized protein n=1 Tax=Wickerhamomyces mucosus TaxID=1378264 RepID=A0A9P8T5T2_9ASCO|nr:hypothetical protein WICMUC_005663 [Wickerhamomyces mucosus]